MLVIAIGETADRGWLFFGEKTWNVLKGSKYISAASHQCTASALSLEIQNMVVITRDSSQTECVFLCLTIKMWSFFICFPQMHAHSFKLALLCVSAWIIL